MTRAVDQKTYWGLGEIVMWIRTGDHEAAAPRGHGKSSDIGGSIPMPPDQALDDLHRKVHNHRVPMTAIKCDGISDEQIPVPPVELNDLMFRLVPGHLGWAGGIMVAIAARYVGLAIAAIFAHDWGSRMASAKQKNSCGLRCDPAPSRGDHDS